MTFSIIRLWLLACIFLCASDSIAQDYYVVIGSFSAENSAVRFTGYARNLRYDASYIRNENNGLYYVYILKTQDKKLATGQTIRLQRETEFSDAWMYYGAQTQPAVVELVREPEIMEADTAQYTPPPSKPVEPAETAEKTEEFPDKIAEPKRARGKYFEFKLITPEGYEVPGNVYSVDRLQGRDLASYSANTTIDVLRPTLQGMPLTIVCEIFGYQEVVKIIDYNDPALTDGAYLDETGTWIVPFTLNRLRKGDISVLYNVSFYKDAVIMLPSSKPELDELVSMMKLNPNYRIKIHGHNNGNEKNLRILMLGNDKNYFGMARSLSKIGSAKELSRLRAETIQSYLVDHGVDKKRIGIYAWGGTAMLMKPGTAAATRLNNRMEVEILDD